MHELNMEEKNLKNILTRDAKFKNSAVFVGTKVTY